MIPFSYKKNFYFRDTPQIKKNKIDAKIVDKHEIKIV
jgi:hypothetical protein